MDLGRGLGGTELSGDEQFDRLAEFFENTLMPDSAALFTEWMDSSETPIGLGQAIKLMEWLMGEWGLSPTEPSSLLATTLGETGHTSAAGVSPTD
jgi:hypothetical protein